LIAQAPGLWQSLLAPRTLEWQTIWQAKCFGSQGSELIVARIVASEVATGFANENLSHAWAAGRIRWRKATKVESTA